MSTLEAALAWAKSGFYVPSISPTTKHAGSVLEKGWPGKTSRDPGQIKALFEQTEQELAIHVGKSGALTFRCRLPDQPSWLQHHRMSGRFVAQIARERGQTEVRKNRGPILGSLLCMTGADTTHVILAR